MMEAGQKIRDYVLDAPIGAGGVGEVWRAHHERLDKPVAIKVILPHLCRDANIFKRFEQEAVAMAKLEHPHIVSVYDFFPVGENACLVMSYIEGGSLEDLIKRHGRLGLAEALEISGGILEALDTAHRQLVVHRDVKPSNILVRPDLHAYLVDFGIALVLGKTRVTKFGTNVGTSEYMSPEQIRGDKPDHQTDVYSFGCVLYEMLAGRPPFGSLSAEGVTDYTIMQRHIKDAPPLLRSLNPKVDQQTEAVVVRALAKDRRDRFAGCAEMHAALLAPAQVRVGIDKPPPIKTLPALKVALGVLVLSTLIAAIGWIYTYRSLQQASLAPHANLSGELLQARKAKDMAEGQANRYRKQLSGTAVQLQQASDELKRYQNNIEQLRDELFSAKRERDKARKKAEELISQIKVLKNQINTKKLNDIIGRED
jgi:serine/threonine-protein kinase